MKVKLSHWTDITERRKDYVANQRLLVEVIYDPQEQSIVVENVWIIEQNCIKIEVSKLLDKAEGCPLATILDAIDWQDLYHDYREEQQQTFDKLPLNESLFQRIANAVNPHK